jgi:benzoate-CoA ligase
VPLEIPRQFNIAAHFVDGPAASHPERPAILGEPAAVSYGELEKLVNRAGNALAGCGCAAGDRVLIVLPDSVEFVAAFFGAAKIGAVAVPVNPMTRFADYAYYLVDSAPRVAIVHAAALAEFLPALERNPVSFLVVVGVWDPARCKVPNRGWDAWLAGVPAELHARETWSEDVAFFLYTSGSGGMPKAAIHRHGDMFATSECYAKQVLALRADDRTFSVSKLFFAYGLGNGMYFPFSVGANTVYNPERPRPERVAEMVARHRPTVFFAVPTFYAALLRAAEGGLAMDFSSVRLAVSAGEALPVEIFEHFRRRFDIEILDGIGSTEMLHMFISNRPGEARPGSCGFEVPHYEAMIVNEDGEEAAPGMIGDLVVKGPSAFAGYWNQPELTGRTKVGGWVITGDKFSRDAGGFYHYCGRRDDMLKVAGMWVSPGEVENVLLGHPQVAEAALVGKTGADGLTRPLAYVVLRAGAAPGAALAAELQEFVRGRLVGYKCPQQVLFLDELPKTATGKVQRYRLRERARGEPD